MPNCLGELRQICRRQKTAQQQMIQTVIIIYYLTKRRNGCYEGFEVVQAPREPFAKQHLFPEQDIKKSSQTQERNMSGDICMVCGGLWGEG